MNEAIPERRERYYVDEGRGHDYLVRCKDCQRLTVYSELQRIGVCPGGVFKSCGNKRFTEIVGLSLWEWLRIKFGLLRFPASGKFLKEFSRGR